MTRQQEFSSRIREFHRGCNQLLFCSLASCLVWLLTTVAFLLHTHLSPFILHRLHLGLCGVTAARRSPRSAFCDGLWIIHLNMIDRWIGLQDRLIIGARKKEFQRPLKPKCDLNDWGAEQSRQSEELHRCGLQMHQSACGQWWISLCVNLLWV